MEEAQRMLHQQQKHWETTYATQADMFGESPSKAAAEAAEWFTKKGMTHILELGGGQGRDTIYFAQRGFHVTVVDYARNGIAAINRKAQEAGLTDKITAIQHDIRQPLPFDRETFDGVFSHMLYCMALNTDELKSLSGEVRRVAKEGALNIYTARNKNDPHFRNGIPRGEQLYENGGFIVHFFDEQLVQKVSTGFQLMHISEIEEGNLPRILYFVVQQKQTENPS